MDGIISTNVERPDKDTENTSWIEETGGGYYGNNSGMQAMLTLPNPKARVRLPMYEYWNAVPGYDGKRRGTRPDHLVETKAANLLRGMD